jgi:hypothetical protein
VLGQAEGAVADMDDDVRRACLGEREPCALGQLRDPLDRVDRAREAAEDGGLVAGPGADVEHELIALQTELLADPRDHVRLRDRLAVPDRERLVRVRRALRLLADEDLPWDRRHRVEQALVSDPAVDELPADPLRPHARHRRRSARARPA